MSVCQPATDLTLHLGDCLDVLPALPVASVHVVVTDPPYGLQFMGQGWDAPWRADRDIGRARTPAMRTAGLRDGAHRLPWPQWAPGANVRCRRCRRWRVSSRPCRCAEPDFPDLRAATQRAYQDWCTRWAAGCLRVLKPGGHLVAFGGTRTYHRLACAIEDAGFEIRDSIHWIYGQGFPKSLNVAKALGQAGHGMPAGSADPASRVDGEWDGWGTALKPAHEPILLARKPLAGTVAANVAAHHTGALHIDACRAGQQREWQSYTVRRWKPGAERNRSGGTWKQTGPAAPTFSATLPPGRWPANIVFSHAPGCADGSCMPGCPVAELDAQSGTRRSGANPARRHSDVFRTVYGRFTGDRVCRPVRGADSGGAARYFPVFRYQPKATAAERPSLPGIIHPTVKPLDLMRWLVRLTTPPGGIVLDPFAGSGTTLHACLLEGVRGIGIERDPGYIELCKARLRAAGRPDSAGGSAHTGGPMAPAQDDRLEQAARHIRTSPPCVLPQRNGLPAGQAAMAAIRPGSGRRTGGLPPAPGNQAVPRQARARAIAPRQRHPVRQQQRRTERQRQPGRNSRGMPRKTTQPGGIAGRRLARRALPERQEPRHRLAAPQPPVPRGAFHSVPHRHAATRLRRRTLTLQDDRRRRRRYRPSASQARRQDRHQRGPSRAGQRAAARPAAQPVRSAAEARRRGPGPGTPRAGSGRAGPAVAWRINQARPGAPKTDPVEYRPGSGEMRRPAGCPADVRR